MSSYSEYLKSLIHGFWNYVSAQDDDIRAKLEWHHLGEKRPPVFHREDTDLNVLVGPDTDCTITKAILKTLPISERHKWFRSMRSSQALAQSVFGNLIVHKQLNLLSDFETDQGLPAFFPELDEAKATLEFGVTHLREPRQTEIDVFFNGSSRVAVECKLAEGDFGTCSRTRLRPGKDKNYERDHCDGTYTRQRGRVSRCTLTEIGVRYWHHIPALFHWSADHDMTPCPVSGTYQLVRNLLAASTMPSESEAQIPSHVLVIYDARNPSFQKGGMAHQQFQTTRKALRDPRLLRSCSWQSLMEELERDNDFDWLTQQLRRKYGF